MQTLATNRDVNVFTPGCVVSVDMGASKIAAALVSYSEAGVAPTVAHRVVLPTRCAEGGQAVMKSIEHAVQTVIDHSGTVTVAEGESAQITSQEVTSQDNNYVPLEGISVCAATSINAFDGSVLNSNGVIEHWTGMPIRANLEDRFHLPANVLGDVQAHALGEARWGASKNASLSLCVAPGTGVGGGIVIDGRLLKGSHGIAGHVGHVLSPFAKDLRCACGCMGHIEPLTSGPGIGALYQGVTLDDPHFDPTIDGAEVSRRANHGDTHAQQIIKEAGFALGQTSASCANILDPDVVVLSGSVCKAGQAWFDAFCEGYHTEALAPVQDIPIVHAQLGDDAPLIGAAEDLLDALATNNLQGKASVHNR